MATYNRVVIFNVQNSSYMPRQNRTAMVDDVSNETLPPPFPPQLQKEIIENNTNYLSKTLYEI